MIIWDFLLPFLGLKEEVYILTNLDFFAKAPHPNIKKIMKPPKNKAGYVVQWVNYVEDALILNEEKTIKKFALIQQRD